MKKRLRICPFRHPHDPRLMLWELRVDVGRSRAGSLLGIYRSPENAMNRAITGKRKGESRGWKSMLPAEGPPAKRPRYPEH